MKSQTLQSLQLKTLSISLPFSQTKAINEFGLGVKFRGSSSFCFHVADSFLATDSQQQSSSRQMSVIYGVAGAVAEKGLRRAHHHPPQMEPDGFLRPAVAHITSEACAFYPKSQCCFYYDWVQAGLRHDTLNCVLAFDGLDVALEMGSSSRETVCFWFPIQPTEATSRDFIKWSLRKSETLNILLNSSNPI